MTYGIAEIFLGIAIAIYIYMILNRICQCFESCIHDKMMSEVYMRIDPSLLNHIIGRTKET